MATSQLPVTPPPVSTPERKPIYIHNDPDVVFDLRIEDHSPPVDTPQRAFDSPRTKVADKFKRLDLAQSPDEDLPLLPRKRLKRNEDSETEMLLNGGAIDSAPRRNIERVVNEDDLPPLEIGETPAQHWRSSSPHSCHLNTKQHSPEGSPIAVTREPKKRLISPPPPSSPRSESQDSSLENHRVILTWREDEITGHNIDPNAPDDDGEGINGIGFKPTPSIVYARKQKRKQQVSEWRSREAKEARQKRFERRMSANGAEAIREIGAKRRVRFLGVE